MNIPECQCFLKKWPWGLGVIQGDKVKYGQNFKSSNTISVFEKLCQVTKIKPLQRRIFALLTFLVSQGYSSSRKYLKHISNISWAYLWHILDISMALLEHFLDIFWTYLGSYLEHNLSSRFSEFCPDFYKCWSDFLMLTRFSKCCPDFPNFPQIFSISIWFSEFHSDLLISPRIS